MARDSRLIEKRNEKLLKRYYFWTEVERLRFDDTLKVLSEEEFFISEQSVLRIIQANLHRISEVVGKPEKKIRRPRLSGQLRLLFEE